MTWNDQRAGEPAQPSWEPAQPMPAEPVSTPSGQPAAFGGVRRTVATVALAIGLLVVGGTAVVLAADPSASPDPSATTAPSTGTIQPRTQIPGSKDCPNMGRSGSGGSNGSDGSGGSTAPSTTPPTSSPEL